MNFLLPVKYKKVRPTNNKYTKSIAVDITVLFFETVVCVFNNLTMLNIYKKYLFFYL